MKNLITGICVLMVVAFVWCSTPVRAEQLLTAKVDSATIAKDKNGAEYVRLIIAEQKEVGGVKYQKTVPVLAFREHVAQAKSLRAGDTLKAIVSHSALPDGRESYRIMAFADAGTPAKKK